MILNQIQMVCCVHLVTTRSSLFRMDQHENEISVFHSSTGAEVISLGAGRRMRDLLSQTQWD